MTKKIKIYNTQGRQKEILKPARDDLVRIYSCGPTVYDYAHIGNLRKYIFDDVLVRTLKYFGYKVKHVTNITDVGHLTSDEDTGEDKIEKGARREGKTAWEIARFYEKAFFDDLKKLNILRPDLTPRATDNIKEQIELIRILEKKGYTYRTSDGIYFDTAKFPKYGELAGLDLKGQKAGARVEKKSQKRNAADFALWRFSPKDKKRTMEWPSPWGKGFPGWHLECSAMSAKFLGQPFEIHTGGVDHIPVHHTNEIAQSEAAYSKPLAKYWLHSEFLTLGGGKMAKSADGYITLKEVEKKGYEPLDFRYLCLTGQYRSKLNFSWDNLEKAKRARQNLRIFGLYLADKETGGEKEFYQKAKDKFENALADDLDLPKALAVIFDSINEAYQKNYLGKSAKEFLGNIERILAIGLLLEQKVPSKIKILVEKRNILREEKRFKESDKIREEINRAGFEIEDLAEGKYLIYKK